jgi:hypothetical protein
LIRLKVRVHDGTSNIYYKLRHRLILLRECDRYTIHDTIRSLSKETQDILHEIGEKLLVGYAYDNFDINFKTLVPTVERPGDTLTHLTSGCLIFLEHGISLSDLNCSDELWASSRLNPSVNGKTLPTFTCANLETLHPEPDHVTL